MKKLLLLLPVVLIYCRLWAQHADSTIYFDVQAHHFYNIPASIPEGTIVTLHYQNINPFLYQSNTNFTDINHDYNDGLSLVQSGISEWSKAKAANTQVKEITSQATDSIIAGYKGLYSEMLESSGKSTKEIKDMMNALKESYSARDTLLNSINHEFLLIQDAITRIKSLMTLDTLIKLATGAKENNTKDKMKDAILLPLAVPVSGPADVSRIFLEETGKVHAGLEIIQQKMAAIRELDKQIELVLDENPLEEADTVLNHLQEKTEQLSMLYSGNNLDVMMTNITVIASNLNKAVSADFTINSSKTCPAKGDYLEISDQIKDKAGNVLVDISPFRIKTVGGSRVDCSVGLASTFGAVNGHEYSLRKNPDDVTNSADTAKIVLHTSDNNRQINMSPVVFVHWYRTSKHPVQWMLSAGLAPDFTTLANSKLFLGTSLGFPSSNEMAKRMVLSIGIAAGYTDVLKSKYENWADYKRFGELGQDDLTDKALRAGVFVGISYNLGGSGHK